MSNKKQTKNRRQIAKSHELHIINNLHPIIAFQRSYGPFYQNRLTLLVGINVFGIFDNQLSTCSKIHITLITITLITTFRSIRSLFSILNQLLLNENKYRRTNNFKGAGLKHCVYEFFFRDSTSKVFFFNLNLLISKNTQENTNMFSMLKFSTLFDFF